MTESGVSHFQLDQKAKDRKGVFQTGCCSLGTGCVMGRTMYSLLLPERNGAIYPESHLLLPFCPSAGSQTPTLTFLGWAVYCTWYVSWDLVKVPPYSADTKKSTYRAGESGDPRLNLGEAPPAILADRLD